MGPHTLCRECQTECQQTGRGTWYCPDCDTCPDCGCPNADGFRHYDTCDREICFDVTKPDVWGNIKEGFEVNDYYPSGRIYLKAHSRTDKGIIRALKAIDYFRKGCRFSTFKIDDDGNGTIYITNAKTDWPLCRLMASE